MKKQLVALLVSVTMCTTLFYAPVMADDAVEEIEKIVDNATTEEKGVVTDNSFEEKIEEITADADVENVKDTVNISNDRETVNEKEYYYRYEYEDGDYEDYWNVPYIRIGDKEYYYCEIHDKYLDVAPEIDFEASRDELRNHNCIEQDIVSVEEMEFETGLDIKYIPRKTDKYAHVKEKGTWKLTFDNDEVGSIYTDENLDIVLNGTTNEIKTEKHVTGEQSEDALEVYGNLTVEGEGSLSVSVGNILNEDTGKWIVPNYAIYVDENITITNKAKVSAFVRDDYPVTNEDIKEVFNNGGYGHDIKRFFDDLSRKVYISKTVYCGDNATLTIDKDAALYIEKSPLSIDVDVTELDPEFGETDNIWTAYKEMSSIEADKIEVKGALDAYSLSCRDIILDSPQSFNASYIEALRWIDDEETGEEYPCGSINMSNVNWTEANISYYPVSGVNIETNDLILSNSSIGSEDYADELNFVDAMNSLQVDNKNESSSIYAFIETSKIVLDGGKLFACTEYADWGSTISNFEGGNLTVQINSGELTAKGEEGALWSNAKFNIPNSYKIVEGARSLSDDNRIVSKSHGKPFIHICDKQDCEEVLKAIENRNSIEIVIGDDVITDTSKGDGWVFDKDTMTLTLEDFNGTNDVTFSTTDVYGEDNISASAAIYSTNDLNINVIGNNTISATAKDKEYNSIIYSAGNLNIYGNGTISVPYDEDANRIDDIFCSEGELIVDTVKIEDELIEDYDEDDLGFKLSGSDQVKIKNNTIKLRVICSSEVKLDKVELSGKTDIVTKEYYEYSDDRYLVDKISINDSTVDGDMICASNVEIASSEIEVDDNCIIDENIKIYNSKADLKGIYMNYYEDKKSSIDIENSNVKVISEDVAIINCDRVDFKSGRLEVSSIGDYEAFNPKPKFNFAEGYGFITNTDSHVVVDKISEKTSGEVVVASKIKNKQGEIVPAEITLNAMVMDKSGTTKPIPVEIGLSDKMVYQNIDKGVITFEKAKEMPAPDGYTFKGWFTKENGKNKKVSKLNAKKLKSMTVTAIYVENEYSIVYKITKPVAGAKIDGKAINLKKIKYSEAKNIDNTIINAKDKSGNTVAEFVGWSEVQNAKVGTDKIYAPGEEVSKLAGKNKKDKKVVLYSVWK